LSGKKSSLLFWYIIADRGKLTALSIKLTGEALLFTGEALLFTGEAI
jgi:hypothetical protein